MKNFSFLKNLLFAFAAIAAVVACDDEYSELGSDVVDGDIHNNLTRTYAQVVAYDKPLGAVQINGYDVNYLGVLGNPVFGKTTASYITQAQLASTNPTFTDHVVIDSAWVYVPYSSNLTGTKVVNDTTQNTYTLNDVYGDTLSTLTYNLDIRRNNYYLRSNDASTGGSEAQYYYSDDAATLMSNQGVSLLAGGAPVPATIDANPVQRRATYTNDDGVQQNNKLVESLAPGIFQYLNPTFFQTLIDQGRQNGSLVNNNVFKDYFRGVSFIAEQVNNNSRIIAPKFSSGYIKITYMQDDFDSDGNIQYEDDGTTVKRERLSITINLTGTHVNILQNENVDGYLQKVNNSDEVNGDDRLYIKGGVGSMAVINLSDADLNVLKNDKVLINQASLKFYVDQQNIPLTSLPLRVYLYDLTNKRPLYDYSLDNTKSSNTKLDRYVYGGILRDSATPFYRVSLTNHINNIIRRDSTNIKLGLVVTDNIGTNTNAMIRTPFTTSGVTVKTTPTANVNHPQGVVLYGSNIPAGDPNYNKRLQLEIFYTKKED